MNVRVFPLKSYNELLLTLWDRLWALPIIIVSLGLTGVIGYSEAGRFVSTPVDEPVRSDLVVSLGGEVRHRMRKAIQLWRTGFAPRIFITGHLAARLAFLADQGVPDTAILSNDKSRHSWDEAVNTYHLMKANGWKSVLVVSDPPHMRRLSWTWEHVFVGSGMSFRLIPAPMPGWDAAHWWRDPGSARYVKAELGKLVFYLFRYGSEGPEYELPTVRAAD